MRPWDIIGWIVVAVLALAGALVALVVAGCMVGTAILLIVRTYQRWR